MTRKSRVAKPVVTRINHPVAKKLRLIKHAHTGKLVHRQHTSYAFLMILLVITGFFVFIGYDISRADSGSVAVRAIVEGPPPSTGAVITQPRDGEVFQSALTTVKGTCADNTEVFVYSNSSLVGSVLCSLSLTFELQVQLFSGKNNLTALNHDTLGQAGPVTPTVRVTYKNPAMPDESSVTQPGTGYPGITPGVTPKPPLGCGSGNDSPACHMKYINANTCNGYINEETLPTIVDTRVSIVCQPRYVDPFEVVAIGVLVWGGTPPYTASIQWGGDTTSGADTSYTFLQPGYYVLTASYSKPGNYTIKIQTVDSRSGKGYAQADILVPGENPLNTLAGNSQPKNFGEYLASTFSMSWFNSPVPTYLLVVAIVLGFWAGDYFERSLLYAQLRRIRKQRKGLRGV